MATSGPSRVSRRASTKTKEARHKKHIAYLQKFRNGAKLKK